jgi:2,3-bisphosphoglycerate-dependent phosphoglycerate mutase
MPRDFQRPFVLPEGATEVMLVRHGSSARQQGEEGVDLIDGHSDPPLDDAGLRQAEAVAARLARWRTDQLFVTPLRRTSQTAAPLAGRLGRTPVVVPELREVNLGDWEGQLNSRVANGDELSKEIFAAERWDVIPNAEPMDAFSDRVHRGMAHLVEAVGPQGVAVAFVHGGVIAEACRQATGSKAFAFLYAENASITRLVRMASGRWALISFNDTAHLEDRGGM